MSKITMTLVNILLILINIGMLNQSEYPKKFLYCNTYSKITEINIENGTYYDGYYKTTEKYEVYILKFEDGRIRSVDTNSYKVGDSTCSDLAKIQYSKY